MSSVLHTLRSVWNGIGMAVAMFYYNWGVIFARWGQPHRAFWYMNRSVTMNSTNPKGYYQRGSLYMVVGNHQSAVQDFSTAIRLDPEYADAYTRRGIMYTLMGRDDEANQDFDRSVQLGTDRVKLEKEIGTLRRTL
jgi:lipoprotein NlpI